MYSIQRKVSHRQALIVTALLYGKVFQPKEMIARFKWMSLRRNNNIGAKTLAAEKLALENQIYHNFFDAHTKTHTH